MLFRYKIYEYEQEGNRDRGCGTECWDWRSGDKSVGGKERKGGEGGEEGKGIRVGETSRRLETGELRACLQRDPLLAEAPRLPGTFTADGFSSVGSCGEDETGGGVRA